MTDERDITAMPMIVLQQVRPLLASRLDIPGTSIVPGANHYVTDWSPAYFGGVNFGASPGSREV
jgi:hypothetical protein